MAELDKINVNGELYDMSDSKARSDIASEITNRTNADATLQTNIDNEANARTSADNELNQKIVQETTNRTNADNALQEKINTNKTGIDNLVNDVAVRNVKAEEVTNVPEVKLPLDEVKEEIEAAGNRVLNSIPDDYTQINNDISELKSDLTLINELVVSVSLEEKIAATTDFSAKSTATLNGNHYTSTGVFGGISGFKNRNHYKLVFVPEIEGYYTLKTILSGAYIDTILPSTYIPGNEPYVIDIPDTIDFSNASKYILFLKGNTYCESADLFVYDVSRISEEVLANIDFTTCANPVVYHSIYIPQKTFKNGLIAENILYGKDTSFLGDSLTATGSGSQYIGYVKDGLGLSNIHNCGIGGSRVSGNDENSFWTDNRVNSLSLDSDCLFVIGGTNDAPYTTVQDSDFTIDNHNTNNFVGAYNVLISKVLYKYLKLSSGYYSDIDYSGVTQVEQAKPYFRIILITPPKRFDSLSNLQKVENFADYVIRIADMWGLPVCDVNHQMNMNIINKDIYFGGNDYIHFKVNAHKELANIVIGKVKSLN